MLLKRSIRIISLLLAALLLSSFCVLGVGAAASSSSFIAEFKSDYAAGNVPNANGVSSVDSDGVKVLQQRINSKSQDFCFDITDSNGAVKLNDGSVYAVSVTYKVVRVGGEDPTVATSIGLVRKMASGGELVKIKSFSNVTYYVGDTTDWVTATIVFKASVASSPEYNQIGINIVSPSCPSVATNIEKNITEVLFKEITVIECNSNTKSIELDSNGGSHCETVLAQANEKIELPTPTRDLYDFKGWYTDRELKTKFTKTNMPNYLSYKLYAKWEVSSEAVSVKYVTHSDEKLSDTVGRKGDAISLPKLKMDGFHFAGWYDKEYKNRYSFDKLPESDVTLYAKWEIMPKRCTFENTDAFPKPDNALFTQRCILTTDDKASGAQALHYSFQRGFELTGSAGKGTPAGVILIDENGEYIRMTAGKTYVVSFRYKVVEYKSDGWITLISAGNGGAWVDRKVQFEDCNMKYDESSLKKGWKSHTFTVTWDSVNDSSNYCYIGIAGDSCVYVDDILVYEKLDKFTYDNSKAMLCFETNDNSIVDTIYAEHGAEVKLPVLEKEGYRFLGWTYDADRMKPVESETLKLDKVCTLLYADWFEIPPKSETPAETPDETPEQDAEPADNSDKSDGLLLYIIIGVAAIVIIGGAVVTVVAVKKRKKA